MHQVNIFYTAPTAIRALMKEGDTWPTKHDLVVAQSARERGRAHQPRSPGCGTISTSATKSCRSSIPWWQTETGGILITPLPGAIICQPGSATRPFFGVFPSVVKRGRLTCQGERRRLYLVIDKPWPGMLRGTYGDPRTKRIKEVYFSRFPGKYFTGDGARVDEDGDYWLMGRVDDV